jgi:hypothetical protein
MTEEKTPSQPSRSSGKEVESNVLLATKNLRWFIRKGATTNYVEGFTNKDEAHEWVRNHPNLEWSVGGLFKLWNHDKEWSIVNRKGIILS